MKDKIKILLGKKDIYPYRNKDSYINLELYKSADEIQTEIVNNNFNLKEQFNKERRESIKFCIYGTLDSIYSDLDGVNLNLKTNHEDLLYLPRIESGAKAAVESVVKTKNLSKEGFLSKNIFKKNKSCFYFLFELAPGIKNYGETKSLQININDKNKKVYAIFDIPFLFFDSDGELIDFGTDIIDIDLNGNEQVIENDYPFLYGTHWIKNEFNIPRPLFLSFKRTQEDSANNLSIKESGGVVTFVVALDFPSNYGIEEAEVFIKETDAVDNPNKDFIFEPQKLSWKKGEQYKTITIELIDDLFTEDDELLIFGFRDVNYAEQSEKNTFELFIENDDLPSTINFESTTAEIVSNQNSFITYLTASKSIKVPNQTIDLVLDTENSDIVIGEDIENTGTKNNPEYRKTIDLKQGLDIFEVEINIKDNFKYDFEKVAIFKLENPTQNAVVPRGESENQFELTIKDSMVTRYTKYKIDSNKDKGQGIFRLKRPTPTIATTPISFINTNQGPSNLVTHVVTNDFKYRINVINDGERIIYKDRMYYSGETVASISSRDGYDSFSVKLPSNYQINEQEMYFEKSKYRFVISDIQKSKPSASSMDPYNNYSNVKINPQELDSSIEKSGKTYYLTSELSGVRTRMNIVEDEGQLIFEVYNLIIKLNIKTDDTKEIIKQKLRDSGKFYSSSGGGFFGGGSEPSFDEEKIAYITNKIIKFMEDNPSLEPPQPYVSTNSVQEKLIKCKINGTLILSKSLTKVEELQNAANNLSGTLSNNIFTNVINGFLGQNNQPAPATKVSNVKFEENPVVYTVLYEGEENDELNVILMPVEPIR